MLAVVASDAVAADFVADVAGLVAWVASVAAGIAKAVADCKTCAGSASSDGIGSGSGCIDCNGMCGCLLSCGNCICSDGGNAAVE